MACKMKLNCSKITSIIARAAVQIKIIKIEEEMMQELMKMRIIYRNSYRPMLLIIMLWNQIRAIIQVQLLKLWKICRKKYNFLVKIKKINRKLRIKICLI